MIAYDCFALIFPDPGVVVTMKSSAQETTKQTWTELINGSVYTSDDVNIGDIEASSRVFLLQLKEGCKVHYYYIPISKVEEWDGNIVWLKIKEEEVMRKYEKDIPPDR